MADYVSPDARRRIAGGLMAAQYAENPPLAPTGYDFDAAPLSPGLMNFAAQRGQPGVIQKTLGLIPGFDQDGKRGAQSWGNALMSTAQFPIDAVAGFGQAITAPARAYRGEFDPLSEEGIGEGLNVAGNALMGGLAAPKPRGAITSAEPNSYKAYHGRNSDALFTAPEGRQPWGSSSHEVANTYAQYADHSPMVVPVEYRFNNPAVHDARGADWMSIPSKGGFDTTNGLVEKAKIAGNDGVVFKNVRDSIRQDINSSASDVYYPIQRGTTYSGMTGDLLFANGGRPGAAAGAALGAIPDAAALDMSQAARMQRARDMGLDTDRTWYRGGKTARDELKAVGSEVDTPAIWFSSSPQRASDFATMRAEYGNMADLKADYMPSVMPAYTGGNYKTVEGMFQAPNFDRMSKQMEQAKADGYDGVVFKRLNDRPGATGPSLFNSSDVLAKFDGSNIRSPNAAFDPAKADSSNLLFANGGRPGAAAGAALGAIPDTPGIRAYHGSPHDFDRFDLSKIGTGEGEQAYGHGLYFAENEGVARSYQTGLGNLVAQDAAFAEKYLSPRGKAELDSRLAETYAKEAERYGVTEKEIAEIDGPKGAIRDSIIKDMSTEEKSGYFGRMYEVNIKANPDDFLDWDKPLSQQSAGVRDAINRVGRDAEPYGLDRITDDMRPVEISKLLRDPVAIERLKQHNVPGIRYLDQGSRAGGEGSRNLVVFDDKLIEILRKYGLLGMAGGAAAAEYSGGNSLLNPVPASPRYRPGDA